MLLLLILKVAAPAAGGKLALHATDGLIVISASWYLADTYYT
jgi:hypothetical protein